MFNSNDKQLVPFVHQGEVLRPVGSLILEIKIDPAVMKCAQEAAELARKSRIGIAVPVLPFGRTNEDNIIDQ